MWKKLVLLFATCVKATDARLPWPSKYFLLATFLDARGPRQRSKCIITLYDLVSTCPPQKPLRLGMVISHSYCTLSDKEDTTYCTSLGSKTTSGNYVSKLEGRFSDGTLQEVKTIKLFGHLQCVWSHQNYTRCVVCVWSKLLKSSIFRNYIWRLQPNSKFEFPLVNYTGCNRRNGPDFGRAFLMLNYTEKTPKHLYPKLNGFGDNGQWSLKISQLLHTYWLPNSYWNWQEYVVSVMLISVHNIKVTCEWHKAIK